MALAATCNPPVVVVPAVTVFPTLFVWSDGDVSIAQHGAERCGRYVNGEYRFETLHGVGHFMLEEKPDAVADLLLDWISAHPVSA